MQPQVTIVIPTHQRPRLLGRALAHYLPAFQAGQADLLVADSSPEPHAPLPQHIRYLHLPGLGLEAKLERVAPLIATPLAVLCADDDFTSVASILRCAEFLAAHPDHSGAHGHYLRVLRQPGRASAFTSASTSTSASAPPVVEPCYLATHRAGIASDDPRQRLLELNRPYVPLFYAVLRTQVLRLAFGPGHGREDFYASSELALGFVAAMLGKVAVLPTLHTVRDIIPRLDLEGGRCHDLGVVSIAPQYREVYGLFVDRLSGVLAGLSGLPAEASRQALLASADGFVAGYCQRGGRKPLWRKLPKYFRRLARFIVPGAAARQDAEAFAAREAALAAYLAPVEPEAQAEQDDILAKLARTPG